jgi:hypothetical protein
MSSRGSSRFDSSSESSKQSESSMEEGDLQEVEVEPLLDGFLGFAGDDISLFFSIVFVLLLWAFYPETVVAENYGIRIFDFKLYVYWQIFIIPFQIIVDVI